MISGDDRRAVPIYVLITLTLSSIFYLFILKTGHLGAAGGEYVSGLMWCPGVAALLTCKLLGRDLGTLGWKWGKSRYQVACYLIPLGYATLTYSFVWLTGVGGFYSKSFVDEITKSFGLGPLPPWAGIGLYFLFVATTAVISGLIWALWHYPIILFADYNPGTPVWYYLTLFTVGLPLINFVWTWMRLKSGSIWPGVILHASHNTFIQQFFDPLTVYNQKTRYVAGEFGIALYVVALFLAVYFWTRRDEVVPIAKSTAIPAAAQPPLPA